MNLVLCPAVRKSEWRRAATVRESKDQERVLLETEEWSEYLKSRCLSYSGEVVCRAERLMWAQMEPALPPPGLGSDVSALTLASGRMRDLWMKPELSLLPRGEWPDLPRAQVRAYGKWAKITAGLGSRVICNMLPAGQVLRHKGRIVGSGAFAVGRRK